MGGVLDYGVGAVPPGGGATYVPAMVEGALSQTRVRGVRALVAGVMGMAGLETAGWKRGRGVGEGWGAHGGERAGLAGGSSAE